MTYVYCRESINGEPTIGRALCIEENAPPSTTVDSESITTVY